MSHRAQPLWQTLALLAGFAFLYTPIAWIIVYSFSAASGGGVFGGFSLRWYQALLDNDSLRLAAGRSLLLACLAATTATVLGTLAGFALARLPRFPGRSLMLALLAIPLFVPEVLIGFALLMLFVGVETLTGWREGKGMLALVAGHATLGLSLVTTTVFARVAGLDHTLEEAALDLGARPLRVLGTVTLPLALPGIVSGWLLAFTLSFDDVITSSFLAGPSSTTLPMLIYSSVRIGINPQINVIGTLIVVGVALIVTAAFVGGAPGLGRRGRMGPDGSI